MYKGLRVAAVVPAHNEEKLIVQTISTMPEFVDFVVVIDDGSADDTAKRAAEAGDPRVVLIEHQTNMGVGAAIIDGHRMALDLGADVNVVMAGDAQMDPYYLPALLDPIAANDCGFTKANRFYSRDALAGMPVIRIAGNIVLSVATKMASGYWNLFDSQNGYTAITRDALGRIDLDRVARGYSFENDLLIRLAITDVRATDVQVPARYGTEVSGMKLHRVIPEMGRLLFVGFWRRIVQKYVLMSFSPIALFLFTGLFLCVLGMAVGLWTIIVTPSGKTLSTGTAPLAIGSLLVGISMLGYALSLDIRQTPAAASPRTKSSVLVPRSLSRILREVPPARRLPLATYLACQLVFLLWWAAFYPGLMSRDSVIFVLHVTTGPWVNNYSVLYDSMVWLSLHATGGLAALTLAQTIAMSVALAYTVFAFDRLGVPPRRTAVAALIVAALPPLASFTVFVWTDVPFSICVYLVVPTVAHLISLQRQPGWRWSGRTNRLLAALGLELLGACLFRLNGFLVVVLAGILLVVLLPGVRGRLTALVVAAVLLVWVLNTLVYPAFGIQKMPTALAYSTAYADIAVAYADQPSHFTAADLRLMKRVAPLAQWKYTADCYDSDKTTYVKGFIRRASDTNGQLFSLWLRILQRSPEVVLGARMCRGAIAWMVFPASATASVLYYGPPTAGALRIPGNLFGLAAWPTVRHNQYRAAMASRPLSHGLNTVAVLLTRASRAPELESLLWRGATWCYIAYVAVLAFARRRGNRGLLALAAIVAGQQLAVLADNPVQLFRFMAAPIFIGIMLMPLFFVRGSSPPAGGEFTPDAGAANSTSPTADSTVARIAVFKGGGIPCRTASSSLLPDRAELIAEE